MVFELEKSSSELSMFKILNPVFSNLKFSIKAFLIYSFISNDKDVGHLIFKKNQLLF